jgi:hypothetical protein
MEMHGSPSTTVCRILETGYGLIFPIGIQWESNGKYRGKTLTIFFVAEQLLFIIFA